MIIERKQKFEVDRYVVKPCGVYEPQNRKSRFRIVLFFARFKLIDN